MDNHARGAQRASSVHRTQAEAVVPGRRLALKSGGAELVTYGADGRVRSADSIGAAALDERRRSGQLTPRPTTRGTRVDARPSAIGGIDLDAEPMRTPARR